MALVVLAACGGDGDREDTSAPWANRVVDRGMLLPPRFGVTQIGDDYVLGVWRDEFEVEHVRMYGLIKE